MPSKVLFALLLGVPGPAFAETLNTDPDWFALGIGLFGGLALFLAGLDLLSNGLKKAAGQTLKDLLSRLTTNRFSGALTGAFVTGVLNSSSVTTVLVVGFVTAGIMTLSQSVGVIMGANIGSTVTAQLLAFNLAEYALMGVAIGFFMTFGNRAERTRYYGMMIMGLGLVFFGMGLMSDAMNPLRSYEPFVEILERMESPALGILAGAVFTGLVQSSAATVGIAIALASEGLLSLPAGIALALGANIGTCVTAMLAALGKPVEAVRAAIVHVTFNILGVLVWIAFIPELAEIAVRISPGSLAEGGTAVADVPRQIANANTLFNVANTLLFIGFTGVFAKMAEKMVPERPAPPPDVIIETRFLDESALKAPSVALEQVRLEFGRAGQIARGMMVDLRQAVVERRRQELVHIAQRDDEVDILEERILEYLAKLRQEALTEKESRDHQALMAAVVNLESAADVVETDLVGLADRALDGEYEPSDGTRDLLTQLFTTVEASLGLAVTAVRDNDVQAAESVLAMKERIRRLTDDLLARKAERLGRSEPEFLAAARIEMSFVDKLRHLYTLSKRIAKEVLPETVAAKVD